MQAIEVILTGVLVGVGAVGCGDNDDLDDLDDLDGDGIPDVDEVPPGSDELPPSNPRLWMANVVPINGDIYRTLGGTGRVQSYTGEQAFNATLVLSGDAPGAVRPWHVHPGGCPGGAIVGPPAAYPAVVIGSDGSGAAETNVLIALDDGAYSVNVHESETNLANVIACGELIRVQ